MVRFRTPEVKSSISAIQFQVHSDNSVNNFKQESMKEPDFCKKT